MNPDLAIYSCYSWAENCDRLVAELDEQFRLRRIVWVRDRRDVPSENLSSRTDWSLVCSPRRSYLAIISGKANSDRYLRPVALLQLHELNYLTDLFGCLLVTTLKIWHHAPKH